MFDLFSSIVLLILFPVILFFLKERWNGLLNIFRVLSGSYTWVGYYPLFKDASPGLPKVKKSILTPVDGLKNPDIPENTIELLNAGYAKNYSIITDARILFTSLRKTGRMVNGTTLPESK